MEDTAGGDGGKDAAEWRRAEADGKVKRFHLIRKCHSCVLYKAKNNGCFAKGHPQMIRTVRVCDDGEHYKFVGSGEIMSPGLDGHYYYRTKPGSPLFAWNDGEVVEVSSAEASEMLTISLAPGTVLQRASHSKKVATAWLNNEDEPLLDLVVPQMPKPRLVHNVGKHDEMHLSLVALSQEGSDDACDEPDETPPKAKRRKSQRSNAGIPGRGIGIFSSAGDANSRTPRAAPEASLHEAVEEEPGISPLATRDEVHGALEEKLRACDKRESELKTVISKANAELEKNDERRKVAIADSEAQILGIIARREAYAAHCENLAAQARAQNIFDRESLRVQKEEPMDETEPPRTAAMESTRETQAQATAPQSSPTRTSQTDPETGTGGAAERGLLSAATVVVTEQAKSSNLSGRVDSVTAAIGQAAGSAGAPPVVATVKVNFTCPKEPDADSAQANGERTTAGARGSFPHAAAPVSAPGGALKPSGSSDSHNEDMGKTDGVSGLGTLPLSTTTAAQPDSAASSSGSGSMRFEI